MPLQKFLVHNPCYVFINVSATWFNLLSEKLYNIS